MNLIPLSTYNKRTAMNPKHDWQVPIEMSCVNVEEQTIFVFASHTDNRAWTRAAVSCCLSYAIPARMGNGIAISQLASWRCSIWNSFECIECTKQGGHFESTAHLTRVGGYYWTVLLRKKMRNKHLSSFFL